MDQISVSVFKSDSIDLIALYISEIIVDLNKNYFQ